MSIAVADFAKAAWLLEFFLYELAQGFVTESELARDREIGFGERNGSACALEARKASARRRALREQAATIPYIFTRIVAAATVNFSLA